MIEDHCFNPTTKKYVRGRGSVNRGIKIRKSTDLRAITPCKTDTILKNQKHMPQVRNRRLLCLKSCESFKWFQYQHQDVDLCNISNFIYIYIYIISPENLYHKLHLQPLSRPNSADIKGIFLKIYLSFSFVRESRRFRNGFNWNVTRLPHRLMPEHPFTCAYLHVNEDVVG